MTHLFEPYFDHYGAIEGTIVTKNGFKKGDTPRIFGTICKKTHWNWPKIARAKVMTLKKWHSDPLKYHLLLFHTIYIYIYTCFHWDLLCKVRGWILFWKSPDLWNLNWPFILLQIVEGSWLWCQRPLSSVFGFDSSLGWARQNMYVGIGNHGRYLHGY